MEVPSIFLNRLLSEVAKKNASDLHLSVGSLPMLRIDGELLIVEGEGIVTVELLNKIIDALLSQSEYVYLEQNREMIIVKNIAGNFRFKINILYQKNLPTINFHYISGVARNFDDLRLPPALKETVKHNSGLIIIAGPYGSGKTTTAVSMIEEINKTERKYIITIEDPVEFMFVSKKSIIEQRQVGRDVKSIAEGLEYSLNEDCDTVYVSKLQNNLEDVLPLVLELASGNSLVILEMNASSAIRALEKIYDCLEKITSLEAARHSLSDVLLAAIAQRLTPKRGGGLVAVVEVLLANAAAKSLIRDGKISQLESIMQTSRQDGMVTMAKALDDLISANIISSEEAERLKNKF
jgi:twitching motility protein PilT